MADRKSTPFAGRKPRTLSLETVELRRLMAADLGNIGTAVDAPQLEANQPAAVVSAEHFAEIIEGALAENNFGHGGHGSNSDLRDWLTGMLQESFIELQEKMEAKLHGVSNHDDTDGDELARNATSDRTALHEIFAAPAETDGYVAAIEQAFAEFSAEESVASNRPDEASRNEALREWLLNMLAEAMMEMEAKMDAKIPGIAAPTLAGDL